jgi:hypothetical protein
MIGTRRNQFSREPFTHQPFVRNLLICTALSLAAPAIAPASVIFTNFGAGHSYDTTGGNPIGNAFDGSNYAEGDTFTPAASATFGSVQVALSCSFGCPAAENFTIAVSSDAGGGPGALIESFNFPATTLGPLGTNNVPVTAASILKPLLTAGTPYWITVTSSLSYSIAWNWNLTGDTADQAISIDGGSSWFSPSGLTPGAFEVNSATTSPVPEPNAGLMISGGLLIGLRCRRSKTATNSSNRDSRRNR